MRKKEKEQSKTKGSKQRQRGKHKTNKNGKQQTKAKNVKKHGINISKIGWRTFLWGVVINLNRDLAYGIDTKPRVMNMATGNTLQYSIQALYITGWWFGTFFIFPYIGNNHPN